MAITEAFYYVEGSSSVKNLVKTLVNEVVTNAGIYKWNLAYPASINAIGATASKTVNLITDGSTYSGSAQTSFTYDESNDKCILQATTSYGKTFYVKIDRAIRDLTANEKKAIQTFNNWSTGSLSHNNAYAIGQMHDTSSPLNMAGGYNDLVSAMTASKALTNIRLQIATSLNATNDDLAIDANIQQKYNYRLAWYRNLQPEIGDFLPVQYWLNVTKDSINLVLRGDPSADVAPYQNYLTSYAYIGALTPVEDSASTDDAYNFGITTSSDVEPNYSNPYGARTATGVTDVCMIANKIGMPYQPHYPAFYATNAFMDKCNAEGSRWNHKKHQFSDITLVHPVDMERGKMINVLAGDASSIYDMDKLVYQKGTDNEENYKKFKITAPFSFLNNSTNMNYCVAVRCYQATE